MGAWGVNVLENDNELDAIVGLEEILGIEIPTPPFDNAVGEQIAALLAVPANLEAALARADSIWRKNRVNADYIALAAVALASGVDLGDGARALILEALADDEWAAASSRRREALDRFAEQVRRRPDGPIALGNRSVVETMCGRP